MGRSLGPQRLDSGTLNSLVLRSLDSGKRSVPDGTVLCAVAGGWSLGYNFAGPQLCLQVAVPCLPQPSPMCQAPNGPSLTLLLPSLSFLFLLSKQILLL